MTAVPGGAPEPMICPRCKTEVRPSDAKLDPEGRAYHASCYQIAYPGAPRSGIVITGVDIGFMDLTAFVFKFAMASLLVGVVLGVVWAVVRMFLPA